MLVLRLCIFYVSSLDDSDDVAPKRFSILWAESYPSVEIMVEEVRFS